MALMSGHRLPSAANPVLLTGALSAVLLCFFVCFVFLPIQRDVADSVFLGLICESEGAFTGRDLVHWNSIVYECPSYSAFERLSYFEVWALI